MDKIEVYTLQRKDGSNPCDSWSTQDFKEACNAAKEHACLVIANVFTFDDSEVADDFTDYGDEEE